MSIVGVGAVLVLLSVIAYALRVAMGDDGRQDINDRKALYRKRRDAFRNDPEAMDELKHWKEKDNDFDYKKL